MDELFGELRSLIHARDRSEEALEQLIALLELAHEDDPARYRLTWLPYVRQLWREWPSPTISHTHELEAWLKRAPLIPDIRITFSPFQLDDATAHDLERSPSLEIIGELIFDRGRSFGPHAVPTLLRSPHLTNLETLVVRSRWIHDTGHDSLCTPRFSSLTHLELPYQSVQLTRLANEAKFERIETLVLQGGWFGDEPVRALARAPWLPGIKKLDLSHCELTSASATTLARCPALSELEELNLYANRLYEEGARSLSRSVHLGSLRTLELHENGIGPNGASALSKSPLMSEQVRAQFAAHDTYYTEIWE